MLKEELTEIKELLNPVETKEPDNVEEETQQADEEVEAQASDEPVEGDKPTDVVDEGETEGESEPEASLEKTYTPTEFAEAVGWETDDIYSSLMIPMKVGENVSLGDFKNKYQDLSHELTRLQAKAVETENTQASGQQSQQMSQDMITLAGNLDQINRVEQGTDWTELEELDPTEAILKRDKIRRARDEVQQAMGELQQKEQASYKEYIGQQLVKMAELIPEWKDNAVQTKDQNEIRTVMNTYGFADEEINTMIDPRQMRIMNDFAKLLEKQKSALKSVKKVRSAPKVLSSNRNVQKGDPQTKVNALVQKATGSGDRNLEHAAIKALLSNG